MRFEYKRRRKRQQLKQFPFMLKPVYTRDEDVFGRSEVRIKAIAQIEAAINWCNTNIAAKDWCGQGGQFYFRNKQDALIVKLTFSGG